MDPAQNYWPINPHDHHHLLSLCSLQPQPQFLLQTHADTLFSTTSLSDQHASLEYSNSSLESPPPPSTSASHYSYNHCYDPLSSPNYASLINSLPSTAVHNIMGLARSSGYNQGSSIQTIGHEIEAESIPGYARAPSPPPPEEQQKYYSYAHTQDPSAQIVSLITPPICPDSFVDMNSPASLRTYSSGSNSTFPTQVGFKPWTRRPASYQDIQIMQGTSPRSSCSLLKKCLRWVLPSLARRELRGQLMNSPRGSGGLIGPPTSLLISHELPSACTHSMISKLNYSNISTIGDDNGKALQQKEAAATRQHMVAERKRRQRQSESFKALLAVVPSIIKKADKVTILERTIHHIKQLQDRVDELQQDKCVLLMQEPTKPTMIDTTGVMGSQQFLSTPTHTDSALEEPLTSSQSNSCRSVSSPETHSELVVTSQADGQSPLFHINMNITVHQPVEANDTIIKAISGLKDKKLNCIHVKSKFSAENSHLSAKILAKFKDGENSTPSADDIMEIKEWWRQLRLTSFTRGREEP